MEPVPYKRLEVPRLRLAMIKCLSDCLPRVDVANEIVGSLEAELVRLAEECNRQMHSRSSLPIPSSGMGTQQETESRVPAEGPFRFPELDAEPLGPPRNWENSMVSPQADGSMDPTPPAGAPGAPADAVEPVVSVAPAVPVPAATPAAPVIPAVSAAPVPATPAAPVVPAASPSPSASSAAPSAPAFAPPAAAPSGQAPPYTPNAEGAAAATPQGPAVTPAKRPPEPISLPNATVGKAYTVDLRPLLRLTAAITAPRLECPEELGLALDAEGLVLSGVPTKDGGFELKLRFQYPSAADPARIVGRILTLTINPDPKSLWKNLPTEQDAPFWKPDFDAKRLPGARTMLAASQRGRSHAHEGKFREDDFSLRYFEQAGGWYSITVADGAGSARLSRRGSQLACSSVTGFIEEHLAEHYDASFLECLEKLAGQPDDADARKRVGDATYHLLGGAAFSAYQKLQEASTAAGAPLKDFATTLITAVARPTQAGWFVGAYWIGDGGAGIYRQGQEIHLLGEPDGGEFAGQTRFLTSQEIWQADEIYRRIRFQIVPDFTALVLMTDGVSDPKFDSEANLKQLQKWDELWQELAPVLASSGPPEEALLEWLGFWSQGNHDDRTIALLH